MEKVWNNAVLTALSKTRHRGVGMATREMEADYNDDWAGKSDVETTVVKHERPLTDEDLLNMGEEIVTLDAEEDILLAGKNSAVSEWTAKIKANSARRKSVSLAYRSGVMRLETECRWEANFETGKIEYFSVESGELIKSRDMTNEERQMKLFDA